MSESAPPQAAVLGDHLRVQPGRGGVGSAAVRAGGVLGAVVVDAVDLDHDAGTVRGQQQEVHALAVQGTAVSAALYS
jgi:hypothetical protein